MQNYHGKTPEEYGAQIKKIMERKRSVHPETEFLLVSSMTRNPICIEPEALSAKAEGIMEQRKITCMFVVDEEHRPLGVLSRHDL